MKIILGLGGLLVLLIFAFLFTQNFFGVFGNKATAMIKNQSYTIDVVKTPKEKQIGLSGKKSIPLNYGMYFPFEKADYYAFWMKDMKFPIDIIFIRENKIVTIHDSVPFATSDTNNLPLYQPDEPADAVLEITAGLSKKNGFIKGDTITFKNLSQ
ncbi:MAG: DUF192 domain-containing protein [Candidatus Levybacteria bacterium]|nr:DUF192 domain-containing protein [Candidatus Levybacteria bacterium]